MAARKKAQPFRFRWEQALRDKANTRPMTKYVGLMLASYANIDGRQARPGQRRLAAVTGLSERAVRKHLAELGQDKWIGPDEEPDEGRRQYHGRPADVFQLLIPGEEYRHDGAGISGGDER